MIRDFFQNFFPPPVAKATLEQQKQRWHSRELIEEQVKKIVSENLKIEVEALTGNSAWYPADDDLESVETIMAFEEDFGIEIPDEDVEHLLTVGQFTAYVFEKLHGAAGELKD